MTLQIYSNGVYTDITPYIAFGGLSYLLADVDSPNAGRTLDALMHRGKITDKDKWQIKCRAMTTAEVSVVLGLISTEYVTVRYLRPKTNSVVQKTMYVGDRTASYLIDKGSKGELWDGLSFSLIER